ncbi:unnamed protein product [Didymodactylos carnosus]|uniref:Uncharacterized protein n=1 Tax=Didymodactylos carnosus TaxID=1234261 RepID=A0A814HF12_9BILA|nr:unnamed protein product [Didymodactylos carnosus]CAF3780404.1 unnamed protein product [Didymodactylos carnosus]
MDATLSLEQIDDDAKEFIFQLVCTARMNCLIRYEMKSIKLPCHLDTTALQLYQQPLEKFHIKDTQTELVIMDKDQTELSDLNTRVEDIYSLVSEGSEEIQLETRRKEI